MRRILILIIFLFSTYNVFPNKMTNYEYWIDFDYGTKVSGTVNPNTDIYSLITSWDLSSVGGGVHSFNVRFKDSLGKWSVVHSSLILKIFTQDYLKDINISSNKILNYEYWLDFDYGTKVSGNISNPNQLINLSNSWDISSMGGGVHSFSIRFKDSLGKWSSPHSSLILKAFSPEYLKDLNITSNKILKYEYWIDFDYGNKIAGNVSNPNQLINLSNNWDISSLSGGLHNINLRFQDSLGKWSVVQSSMFLKPYNSSYFNDIQFASNKIKYYEYWFDNDINNRIGSAINPGAEQYNISLSKDVTDLSVGLHKLSIRFQDSSGKWSSALTHIFYNLSSGQNPNDYFYTSNKIYAYRYWFNNDKTTLWTTKLRSFPSSLTGILQIQCPKLSNLGKNEIHIQFQDSIGRWSVARTDTFQFDGFVMYPPDLYSPANNTYVKKDTVLDWEPLPYTDTYDLQIARDAQFTNIVMDLVGLTTNTKVVNLNYTKNYFWRVRAHYGQTISDWSVVWRFATEDAILSKPIQITPIADAIDLPINIDFKWKKVQNAFKYRFKFSNNADFTNIYFENLNLSDTAITINNLPKGNTFYWKIQGYNNDNEESDWSDTRMLTTIVDNQTIALTSGWNIVSTFVEPLNNSMPVIWNDIKTFVNLVKNNAGQSYIPNFNINQIGNWNKYEGYQVSTTQAKNLILAGNQIKPENTPISLSSGWKIVPYLRTSPMLVPTALATLVSQNALTLCKNNAGQSYIPQFNINQIGNLLPGQGYQIFLSKNATLTYPANGSGRASAGNDITPLPKILIPEYKNTGNNSILLVQNDSPNGDEIGVYNQKDMLIGSGIFHQGIAAVTIWGDDEQTEITDGAKINDELRIKNYDAKTGRLNEIKLTDLVDLIDCKSVSDFTYSKDAFIMAKVEAETQEIDKYDMKISPNPFSDELSISLFLPAQSSLKCKIYNLDGVLVNSLYEGTSQVGINTFNLKGTNLASGEYTIVISIGEEQIVKKVMKVK